MEITKFLEECCSSLSLDNSEDRTQLNKQLNIHLNNGINAINKFSSERTLNNDELESALIVVEFVMKFAETTKLPTLKSWCINQYTTLEGFRRSQNVVWPEGNEPSKIANKEK